MDVHSLSLLKQSTMNSYGRQLASWASRIEERKPFFLAVIDGETRLGFVNSHFFLQFQQADKPAEHNLLRCLVDDCDRRRFDNAVATCLIEEKDILLEVRMRGSGDSWVKWELRFLEAVGEGPGRLFCLGYTLSGEESVEAAAANKRDGNDPEPAGAGGEWNNQLARQKELMYKKVREATIRGEEQERERIGHELHDNVNQILTSAQLFLSCLDRENEDFETVKAKTAEILTMAIDEVRALSHNIVPPDLREKGLIESVGHLVDDIRYARRFAIEFTWSDMMTIENQDQALKLTVYRIIQEQIHNICKYSQASNVWIGLQGADEQLRLQVTDDGVGFDPKAVRQGLGIGGICRRAKLFNGKAIFNAAPGKGCTLIVAIPLELKRIV
jgi:signal transduction histidine kinase